MTGHGLSERAGWLFAAAALAIGTTVMGGADQAARSIVAGPTTAQTDSAAVAVASTSAAVLIDRSAFGDTTAGSTTGGSAPAAVLAPADWPPVTPAVATSQKVTTTATTASQPAAVWWAKYHGTNHVWMPTIGISRTVYVFPCSRSAAPDNLVYRWGCAGANNVYLLGHAYGVFKALHDAYANGKLRVGMPVVYADSSGRTHLYRVTTWRIVSPADAGWAIAAQARPSMTLQTCIGPNGTQRLNVRLVEVKA